MRKLQVLVGEAPVGELAETRQGEIYFEYAAEFIAQGFSLSPYFLPLRPGLQRETTLIFEGLFGVFDDSLPDGWGRLLMDRDLRQRGIDPSAVSPLDRLAYLSARGMGALSYRPATRDFPLRRLGFDLAETAAQAGRIVKGSPEEVLPALLALGGSPGGARPKIVVGCHPRTWRVVAGGDSLPRGYEPWLIKFRAREDPADIGRIEAAYSAMAREAGIEVPATHLFTSAKEAWFGVRRFDRGPAGKRIHTHTWGGLAHANFRHPNRDYQELLSLTLDLTKDYGAVAEAYRRMVFNVLAHNRDDHVKNFAFQYRPGLGWSLAPAYDLTYSAGVRGQHNTTVLGAGIPSSRLFGKMAESCSLDAALARSAVEQVRSAVGLWDRFARDYEVSAKLRKAIGQTLHRTPESR